MLGITQSVYYPLTQYSAILGSTYYKTMWIKMKIKRQMLGGLRWKIFQDGLHKPEITCSSSYTPIHSEFQNDIGIILKTQHISYRFDSSLWTCYLETLIFWTPLLKDHWLVHNSVCVNLLYKSPHNSSQIILILL